MPVVVCVNRRNSNSHLTKQPDVPPAIDTSFGSKRIKHRYNLFSEALQFLLAPSISGRQFSLMIKLKFLMAFGAEPGPSKTLSRPAQRVLAIAALKGSCPRDVIAELVWPEADRAQGLFYLRRTLSELRRAWGENNPCPLQITDAELSLDRSAASADIDQLKELYETGDIERAVTVFGSGLLPTWTDEWLETARLSLELDFQDQLMKALKRAEGRGEIDKADFVRRELLNRCPDDEKVWQSLIQDTLLRRGQTAAAELLEECDRILRSRTGVGASRETRQILELKSARRQHQFAPLPSLSNMFVGRDEEVGECLDLIATNRLVTVLGAGGVGKTCLVSHVVQELVSLGTTDIGWVELAPVLDAKGVAHAFSTACGIPPSAAVSEWESFVEAIAQSRLILVVDSAEHLIGEVAYCINELLTRAPGVTLLITSRVPLRLSGEVRYRLSSLSERASLELLMRRLKAAHAPLDSLPDLRSLCLLLDGIPLAIELCSAQLALLPANDLTDRIQSLLALDSEGINRSSRYETMRAAIEVSVNPLPESLARGLVKLSVFVGSFDVEAAEAVAGLTALHLAKLAEHSLLEFDGRRYKLLEPMRLYCAEQLAAMGEIATIRTAYAEHFGRLASRLYTEPSIRDTAPFEFQRLRTRLGADRHNLEAAHAILVEAGGYMSELAACIRNVLIVYMLIDAGSDAAVEWARRLDSEPIPDTLIAGHWVLTVATYCNWISHTEIQRRLLERAATMKSVQEHSKLKVRYHLCRVELDRSVPLGLDIESEFQLALAAANETDSQSDQCWVSAQLAEWYVRSGIEAKAIQILEPLIPTCLTRRDARAGAIALRAKSRLTSVSTWEEQREIMETACTLQKGEGHWAYLHSLSALGDLAREHGQLQEAREYVKMRCAFSEETHDLEAGSHAHQTLAELELQLGRPELAVQSVVEGLKIARLFGRQPYLHVALLRVGMIFLETHRIETASIIGGYVNRAIELRRFPANSLILGLLGKFNALINSGTENPAYRLGGRSSLGEVFEKIYESADNETGHRECPIP